jgi:hypothetical protein
MRVLPFLLLALAVAGCSLGSPPSATPPAPAAAQPPAISASTTQRPEPVASVPPELSDAAYVWCSDTNPTTQNHQKVVRAALQLGIIHNPMQGPEERAIIEAMFDPKDRFELNGDLVRACLAAYEAR